MSAGKKGGHKAPASQGIDNCGTSHGRWFNYERIGLYWRRKRGERINFCDLHFYGSLGDIGNIGLEPEGHNGSYSGPDQSIIATNLRRRTQDERDMYGHRIENLPDDDAERPGPLPPWEWRYAPRGVDRGGGAYVVRNKENRTYECWLFGPLSLMGPDPRRDGVRAYGSLVVELDGFDQNPWKANRRAWDGPINSPTPDTPWDTPGKGRVGVFRPAALWGSHYITDTSQILKKGGTGFAEELIKVMKTDQVFPAHLPSSVISVEWKVEAASTKLTLCEIYDQRG
jgi:hypothetical protein